MSEPLPAGAAPPAPRPGDAVTLSALSLAFLKIAMASLGGGLSAWALRVIVEERRWLTEEEFLAAYTICRILPGPNQVNMAVYVGTHFRGLAGAAAALAGLTLVPLAIVLGLGVLYFGHRKTPGLQAIMAGLVAAAAGMTLSVGVKLSLGYVRQPVALAARPGRVRGGGRHAVAAPARARGARSHRDRLVLAARARRARGGTSGVSGGTLVALIWVFASASVVSFGGGNIVLPELHRQSVAVHAWLTDEQFAAVYAISQGAPGPSTGLLAGLIGLEAGGWPGALVAAAAMLVPGAALMYLASLAMERFRASKWRGAVQQGLAPVSMGLLFAAGVIIVRAADHGWTGFVVTAVTTALLVVTKVNPLLVMAGARPPRLARPRAMTRQPPGPLSRLAGGPGILS